MWCDQLEIRFETRNIKNKSKRLCKELKRVCREQKDLTCPRFHPVKNTLLLDIFGTIDGNLKTASSKTTSEADMRKFRTMLAAFFRHAKGEHIKGDMALNDVQISVESESSGRCSFSLQQFLDDLYGKEKKERDGMARCWQVLFGDTDRIHKKGITKGLLSQWKVTYKKHESYVFSTRRKGKGEYIFKVFHDVLSEAEV